MSLTYASGVLHVVVGTVSGDGRQIDIDVEFDGPRGFRLLDGGDLIRYWEAKVFAPGYHVFEITSGGWRGDATVRHAQRLGRNRQP